MKASTIIEGKRMLTTEKVAYWYFRLNGYFQMENFIVHPETGSGGQRTDADLIGVRFPFRAERFIDNPDKVMLDDLEILKLQEGWTDVVVVEVKTNVPCSLNGPWTNAHAKNVQRVLSAIGYFKTEQIEDISAMIYGNGFYEDRERMVRLRMVAIGREQNEDLARDMPDVLQIVWKDVLNFIGDRLHTYRSAKTDNHQWDDQMKLMQSFVLMHRSGQEFQLDGFVNQCLGELGVRAS